MSRKDKLHMHTCSTFFAELLVHVVSVGTTVTFPIVHIDQSTKLDFKSKDLRHTVLIFFFKKNQLIFFIFFCIYFTVLRR